MFFFLFFLFCVFSDLKLQVTTTKSVHPSVCPAKREAMAWHEDCLAPPVHILRSAPCFARLGPFARHSKSLWHRRRSTSFEVSNFQMFLMLNGATCAGPSWLLRQVPRSARTSWIDWHARRPWFQDLGSAHPRGTLLSSDPSSYPTYSPLSQRFKMSTDQDWPRFALFFLCISCLFSTPVFQKQWQFLQCAVVSIVENPSFWGWRNQAALT